MAVEKRALEESGADDGGEKKGEQSTSSENGQSPRDYQEVKDNKRLKLLERKKKKKKAAKARKKAAHAEADSHCLDAFLAPGSKEAWYVKQAMREEAKWMDEDMYEGEYDDLDSALDHFRD
jgi:3-methyladenine DNA glycosylase AlkC